MRTLALSFLFGVFALSTSCQTSLANGGIAWDQQRGNYYRTGAPARTTIRHAQVSAPATTPRVSSNGLVPNRPLSTPTTPPPTPDCAAVCIIDPRTGRLLYTYNAHTRRQVASTQKIITALCVTDAGNLDKWVTINAEDAKGVPPIKMNLRPGTRYRKRELLKVMLTGSYNDLANTLARDTAGSVQAFVRRMNARARRMNMRNTYFANANGLPAEQYSTAYDMALAACYAYNNSVIRRCINIPEFEFRLADGSSRKIESTNKLLKDYPWVQGMKTGYTDAAGKCLISCASRHGQSVIVVILGSTNKKIWDESLKYLKWALPA